jgi:hypothetical protein
MEQQKRPTIEEDRLITLEELAAITGLNYRSILQSRTEKRFLLQEVRPSPGLIRVRLSDAQAVVRGEKQVMSAYEMTAQRKSHTKALAKKKSKGGGK